MRQVLKRLLRATAPVLLATLGGAAIGATCADVPPADLASHVVMLEADNPSDPNIGDQHATGIIVSDSGLVLTAFDLIEQLGVRANDLFSMTAEELQDNVRIRLPQLRDTSGQLPEITATILGHDWRRNLLLLKMPPIATLSNGLAAATLTRRTMVPGERVCFMGFRQSEQTQAFAPVLTANAQTWPTAEINWRAEGQTVFNSEMGGAVLDQENALVGMLVGQDGQAALFLPIEYADTLLSQLFISRIMRDLENFQSVSDQIKTGVTFGFQILDNQTTALQDTDQFPALIIRFFFNQHIARDSNQTLTLRQVDVLTRAWGLRKDPDQGEVTQEIAIHGDAATEAIRIDSGSNYFDYDATDFLELAQKQGFSELTGIRLKLAPVFALGKKKFEPRDGRVQDSIFEIPLNNHRN